MSEFVSNRCDEIGILPVQMRKVHEFPDIDPEKDYLDKENTDKYLSTKKGQIQMQFFLLTELEPFGHGVHRYSSIF
jgi:hypothetical protein